MVTPTFIENSVSENEGHKMFKKSCANNHDYFLRNALITIKKGLKAKKKLNYYPTTNDCGEN